MAAPFPEPMIMTTAAAHAEPALDFDQAREDMVERQVRTWDVFDPAVLDVMKSVARETFVPERFRNLAYSDTQIPLGTFDGRTEVMMQPKVEGRLLQALAIKAGDRVLEIGTGSGYLTSLLAKLGGNVLSLDIRPEMTALAKRNLAALGVDTVELETRDAATLEGINDTFDCIVVTGSMPRLHPSFCEQLKLGGRLFVILGTEPIMEAQLHTRITDGDWVAESLFDTVTPPLVNAWNPRRFVL